MLPEACVVSNLTPSFTDPGYPADLSMGQVAENVEDHLVREFLDRLNNIDRQITSLLVLYLYTDDFSL